MTPKLRHFLGDRNCHQTQFLLEIIEFEKNVSSFNIMDTHVIANKKMKITLGNLEKVYLRAYIYMQIF